MDKSQLYCKYVDALISLRNDNMKRSHFYILILSLLAGAISWSIKDDSLAWIPVLCLLAAGLGMYWLFSLRHFRFMETTLLVGLRRMEEDEDIQPFTQELDALREVFIREDTWLQRKFRSAEIYERLIGNPPNPYRTFNFFDMATPGIIIFLALLTYFVFWLIQVLRGT